MKTISLKKFRKSGERMTRAQYEKESGLETQAPEVYSYLHFFHIEIHPLKREVGEPFKELYVVHTRDSFETESLKEAEKHLYNEMKSELNPKYPNGVDSWMEAYFEITHSMGYYNAKRNSELLESANSDDERKELASKLATEFEVGFNGEDFHEKISAFVMKKFAPKDEVVVDPKMPLGLDSYLDSFYQISSFIGFQSDRYIMGRRVLKGNDSVRMFLDEFTSYEQGEHIKDLTTQFEKRIVALENSDEDVEFCHLEEIDKFCSERFPSEGEIEVVKEFDYEMFEIASYMGRLQGKDNEIFDALDGADGQTIKAQELYEAFKKEYKDAEWCTNGVGSFYTEIDEFLNRAFSPKKKFKTKAVMTIDYEIEIEADSIEEAQKISKESSMDKFTKLTGSGDWIVGDTDEV